MNAGGKVVHLETEHSQAGKLQILKLWFFGYNSASTSLD
jgi:hypothetical protein